MSGSNRWLEAGDTGVDQVPRWSFESLFEAHKLDVASYCSWRTASSADAEDAVAEVFLVAWRRIQEVPAGDLARAWLYATARRILANQRRSWRRRAALQDRLTANTVIDSLHTATTSAEEAAVHEALAKLVDRDREVLLLIEWEGLRIVELAEVLGCRVVTARGRLYRARRRFREAFETRVNTENEAGRLHMHSPAVWHLNGRSREGLEPHRPETTR